MNPRGRRIALAALALGLLILAGAGWAFKDRVVEEWWLWIARTADARKKTNVDSSLKAIEESAAKQTLQQIDVMLQNVDDSGKIKQALIATQGGFRALQGKVDFDSENVIHELSNALGDQDENTRFYAARVLGEIGSDAIEAVPALQVLSRDRYPLLQQAAAAALKKIQGEER